MSTARFSSAASGAGLLVLEDVTAGYPGGRPVLRNVSLDVQPGEVAGLAALDASGGRSTLVRVAAGLLPPTSGRVLFDGEDVYGMGFGQDQSFRARMATVLEGGALLVNQTVRDNVALPLRYHVGMSGVTLHRTVDRLLAQAGFNEDPNLFTWQVSARGRRLAAFARALARQPKLIIVDRFFEGLEMPDWKRLFELVLELNHQDGVSWLLVSELDPAIFQVAERVAVLDEGRVLDYGHRRRLYRDERIRAAFEAAETAGAATQEARSAASSASASKSRPLEVDLAATHDSERILIVDSNEELEAMLGSGSDDGLQGVDPAGTIALDGQVGGDGGGRPVSIGYGAGIDPEKTVTLDATPPLRRSTPRAPGGALGDEASRPIDAAAARGPLSETGLARARAETTPPASPHGRRKPKTPSTPSPAARPSSTAGDETFRLMGPADVAAARAELADAGAPPPPPRVTRKPSASSADRPPPAPVKLEPPGGKRPAARGGGEETLTIDGQILDEVRRRIAEEAQGQAPGDQETD